MHRKLISVLLLLLSSQFLSTTTFAAEKADFVRFFEEYQRLSSEFDASVSQLYTDDVKIMGARKKPDGTEEKMTIDGTRWKTIILTSMENAKKVGDSSKYTDVVIEVDNNQARISAHRFSTLNCFTDNRFYMVVKSTADDQLQIVEQFMESPAQSNCEGSDTGLEEFLQNTVKIINQQLPAAIDAETQLIKTSADGTKLIYHYVLINFTLDTLTTAQATARLQPQHAVYSRFRATG